MHRGGIEGTLTGKKKARPRDGQAFDFPMAPRDRLELPTQRLTAACSTD